MSSNWFTRREYDKVRKMDHNTMKTYIEQNYNRGFTDELVKAESEINEMLKNIRAIPGIGEKKMNQIIGCMRKAGEQHEHYYQDNRG